MNALSPVDSLVRPCSRVPPPAPRTPRGRWAFVHEVTPDALAAVDGSDPSIAAADDGRVALTWVTRDSGRRRVVRDLDRQRPAFFAAQRLDTRAGRVSAYTESRLPRGAPDLRAT